MKSRSEKTPPRPAKPTVSLQIRMDPALMQRFVEYVERIHMSRTQWITAQIQEVVK